MFFPEGQVRIFVYGEPVNMRLSYDGLPSSTPNHIFYSFALFDVNKIKHLA